MASASSAWQCMALLLLLVGAAMCQDSSGFFGPASLDICPDESDNGGVSSPGPGSGAGTGTGSGTLLNDTVNACTAELFGDAAEWDIFLTGLSQSSNENETQADELEASNAQFGGRVAVNGDATLSGFSLATQLPCGTNLNASTNFNFIVSGELNATNGQLACGSYIYGSRASALFLNQVNSGARGVQGDIEELTGINFNQTSNALLSAQQSLCGSNETIVANVLPFGAISLSSAENGTLIFGLNASALDSASLLQFNLGGQDNTVIINVFGDINGTVTFSNFALNTVGLPATNILWNICDADTIIFSGFELLGSLLAPAARVEATNAQFRGYIWAASLSGTGIAHNVARFEATNC